MNTACGLCRKTGQNKLDKPTGRLICHNCGGDIPCTDAMRNALAKSNMFLEQRPAHIAQAAQQPQWHQLQQVPQNQYQAQYNPYQAQYPQYPQYQQPFSPQPYGQPQMQHQQGQLINPYAQAPAPQPQNPQYSRPTVRPNELNIEAAKRRMAEIHKKCKINVNMNEESGEIREGVVKYKPEVTKEDAAALKQAKLSNLDRYENMAVQPTRKLERPDFLGQELRQLDQALNKLAR